MTWPVLLIRSSQKFEFMTIFMLSRVRNLFLTLLFILFIFFFFYWFKTKNYNSNINTELPCSSDLENPGQLPVHEVFEGTDDCVL